MVHPSLNAFYPSSCGSNTSATLDALINSSFTVTNTGGAECNADGCFSVNLIASGSSSGGIPNPYVELLLGFNNYTPNLVIFQGNVPNATPSGSSFIVRNSVSSSIDVRNAVGYVLEVGWYWTSPTMNYWAKIKNNLGQTVFLASYTFNSQASAQWGMTAFVPSVTGRATGSATFTGANFALSGTIANNAGVDSHASVPQHGEGNTSVCGFTVMVSGEYANIGTSSPSASGTSYSANSP